MAALVTDQPPNIIGNSKRSLVRMPELVVRVKRLSGEDFAQFSNSKQLLFDFAMLQNKGGPPSKKLKKLKSAKKMAEEKTKQTATNPSYFTIVFRGTSYSIKREALIKKSVYFSRLCSSRWGGTELSTLNLNSGKFPYSKFKQDALSLVLKCIQEESTDIPEENTEGACVIADYFGFTKLMDSFLCSLDCVKDMTPTNRRGRKGEANPKRKILVPKTKSIEGGMVRLLNLDQIASKLNLTARFSYKAVNLINHLAQFFSDFSLSDSFVDISFESLNNLLSSSSLLVFDELSLLEAVCRWIRENPYHTLLSKEVVSAQSRTLLRQIKLESLPSSIIDMSTETSTHLLNEDTIPIYSDLVEVFKANQAISQSESNKSTRSYLNGVYFFNPHFTFQYSPEIGETTKVSSSNFFLNNRKWNMKPFAFVYKRKICFFNGVKVRSYSPAAKLWEHCTIFDPVFPYLSHNHLTFTREKIHLFFGLYYSFYCPQSKAWEYKKTICIKNKRQQVYFEMALVIDSSESPNKDVFVLNIQDQIVAIVFNFHLPPMAYLFQPTELKWIKTDKLKNLPDEAMGRRASTELFVFGKFLLVFSLSNPKKKVVVNVLDWETGTNSRFEEDLGNCSSHPTSKCGELEKIFQHDESIYLITRCIAPMNSLTRRPYGFSSMYQVDINKLIESTDTKLFSKIVQLGEEISFNSYVVSMT